ncbi:MAG TPA: IPT/TIG domain-containing protein, partial [Pseudolabrys sp.]
IMAMTASHAQTPPKLINIVPDSSPIGIQVTIHGTGFTATDNTILFGDGSHAYPSGSVHPKHTSSNGTEISFTIPAHFIPACAYSRAPCPFATIPVTPGIYGVAIANANGQSNTQNFTVTAR